MGDDKTDNIDDLAATLGGLVPDHPIIQDQIKDALSEEQNKDS